MTIQLVPPTGAAGSNVGFPCLLFVFCFFLALIRDFHIKGRVTTFCLPVDIQHYQYPCRFLGAWYKNIACFTFRSCAPFP